MRALNTWMGVSIMPAALGLALGGCLAPPVETPVTTTVQETDVRVEQSVKNKVDILFMVDDSNSMDAKQVEVWPFAAGAAEPKRYTDFLPVWLGPRAVGSIDLAKVFDWPA